MGALKILLILVFALFLSRAFFVTVLMHDYYADLAKDNRVRTEKVVAPRGVISDRNGKIIATNILQNGKTKRFYPDGEIVAGVVGYLNESGGVAGVEKQYQTQLAGVDGERRVEETAAGQEVREESLSGAVPGQELKLNLDLPLQSFVYQALKNKLMTRGKAGAVVVTKVNGEVLALVSWPTFDPNLFISGGKRGSEGGSYSDVSSVVADNERQPLFNRTVAAVYPPGSVFKLVTATAGLEEKVLSVNDMIEDSGEIVIGKYSFGNWYFEKYGKTEGRISLTRALARSNDIFFYRLGERLGVDRLASWARKLGAGEVTGIDLPSEAGGLVPTPLWQEKNKGERWFLGNTFNMAIGQGDLLLTPLQVNRVMAGVVSGKKCAPRLVGKGECVNLGTNEKFRRTVIEGMRQACESGGTGFTFFSLQGAVWCKTGTAQHGGETSLPHAWIGVVIPKGEVDDWVVVTVMLEEAGEGSEQAGPVAREIVDYWLAR